MTSGPVLDVELATRLRRVIIRLARMMNESAATEDLTPTQASVLGVIVARGPLGLSAVAELEGINPTMLSRVVGALQGKGLINRRPDESDLRSVVVIATDEGRSLSERIRHGRNEVLTELLQSLPQETATSVIQGLPALEALAEGIPTGHTTINSLRRQ